MLSSRSMTDSLTQDCISLWDQTCRLSRMISECEYADSDMSLEDWRDVEILLLGAKVETIDLYNMLFVRVDSGELQTSDAHIVLNRRKSIGRYVLVQPGPFFSGHSSDESRRPVLKRIEERQKVGNEFVAVCRDIYLLSCDVYDGFTKSDLGPEAFKVEDLETIERTLIGSGSELAGLYLDLLEDFEPEERLDDDVVVFENETYGERVRLRRCLGIRAKTSSIQTIENSNPSR